MVGFDWDMQKSKVWLGFGFGSFPTWWLGKYIRREVSLNLAATRSMTTSTSTTLKVSGKSNPN